ncbi:MAG: tyrosine-type recombinase/integrase [Candidatus Korobacteraceae bacterium]|jgi:integrase
MKGTKRPKLPRGLRWRSNSPFIWFSWRDSRGKQHQQSTETANPAEALSNKLKFLAKQEHEREDFKAQANEMSKLPLERVAELYFNWKAASSSPRTIERERRIFAPVLKFLSRELRVSAVTLPLIREYQQQRRLHVSKTMKQPVTGRTVNYEMHLLRGMMIFADCWTDSLAARYTPLRQIKKRAGKVAQKMQLMDIINKAKGNEYWQVAMYCAAVAVGTGCRSGEIRNLQLKDVQLDEGKIVVRREIAKNRTQREPRLMALADWGLRNLLLRAEVLGATEPEHYLLPLNLRKSKHLSGQTKAKWDITRPMTSWVKSWRKLMEACGMQGFRFHDLRHTFRTLGAEAGVPVEVMMAQLGHMDRETSLEYVHIQQRALERAKQLIESEQADILATAEGRPIERTMRSEASPRRTWLRSRPMARRSRPSYLPRRAALAAMSPARTGEHPQQEHSVPSSSATRPTEAGTMPSPGMSGPKRTPRSGRFRLGSFDEFYNLDYNRDPQA